jgi:hypothetical protein
MAMTRITITAGIARSLVLVSDKAKARFLDSLVHAARLETRGVLLPADLRAIRCAEKEARELETAALWHRETDGRVIILEAFEDEPAGVDEKNGEHDAAQYASPGALRQRRWRDKVRRLGDVTRDVTRDASETLGETPRDVTAETHLPQSPSGSFLSDPNSPDPESSPAISSDPKDLKASARDSETRANVLAVFLVWQAAFSPKAKLDKQRDARIRARLREGYSVEQLQQAIINARNDPHLMGETNGQKYTGLKTLLRDAEQVERLMTLTSRPVAPAPRNGFRRHDDAPPPDRPLHPHEEARVQRILASAKGTA